MQTVVVNDYPAERLPPDRRKLVDPLALVRVTLDVGVAAEEPPPFKPKRLRDFIGAAPGVYGDEDPVDAIRALRDEWD